MAGVLSGDTVRVRDQKEGSQLHNRGAYGYTLSGGGIDLDLVEATYLVESGRLEVLRDGAPMDFEALFRYASGAYGEFDIRYIVYRDIRQRGFIIKNETGGPEMAVYPRGMLPSRSQPEFMVVPVSERAPSGMDAFVEDAEEVSRRNRRRVYAVVDEEGDLTYYDMSRADPQPRTALAPSGQVAGTLVRDRVFVFDADGCAELRGNGFYGKMISGVLQLSLMEAWYLSEEGVLEVSAYDGTPVDASGIRRLGEETQEGFRLRREAYRDLRHRGLTVKTGFKYGTHFRVYEGSPDDSHARYLVHAVSASQAATWPEISRAVRLSGGVKKEILFARVTPCGVEYFSFRWFRP